MAGREAAEAPGPARGAAPEAAAIARVDRTIRASPWRVHRPGGSGAGAGALRAALATLWSHRALVGVLVRRELKARYRGSVLGFGWTLLNPLALLAVYSLVFALYLRIGVEDYALYLLSGLLPWLWLSQTLTSGSSSIVDGSALVTRVMLPPHLLPVVEALANGVNFLLALPVLLALALAVRTLEPLALLAIPAVSGLQAVLLIGVSLPLAGATVLFRDIKFLVQNAVTFWFFLTPIVYTPELVPERLRFLLALNPFAPFARAYQSIVYAGDLPGAGAFLLMAATALAAAALGLVLFERIRERMVEEL